MDARDLDRRLADLQRSAFRRRFALSGDDVRYARSRGRAEIARHAGAFIRDRLGPARPPRDGRQTPMRGHPVFRAQHATATCCRGCLAKWHGIAAGVPLSDADVHEAVTVILAWLDGQMATAGGWGAGSPPGLFDPPPGPAV